MERLLLGLLALLCPLSWFLGSSQTIVPPAIEPPVAITAVAPTTVLVEDTYTGAVFSPPLAENLGLENITGMAIDGYWMPVAVDIAALEERLPTFIEANADQFRRDIPDELATYTRQYIGFYSNGDLFSYTRELLCHPVPAGKHCSFSNFKYATHVNI